MATQCPIFIDPRFESKAAYPPSNNCLWSRRVILFFFFAPGSHMSVIVSKNPFDVIYNPAAIADSAPVFLHRSIFARCSCLIETSQSGFLHKAIFLFEKSHCILLKFFFFLSQPWLVIFFCYQHSAGWQGGLLKQ